MTIQFYLWKRTTFASPIVSVAFGRLFHRYLGVISLWSLRYSTVYSCQNMPLNLTLNLSLKGIQCLRLKMNIEQLPTPSYYHKSCLIMPRTGFYTRENTYIIHLFSTHQSRQVALRELRNCSRFQDFVIS